jgi:hypothetical protein
VWLANRREQEQPSSLPSSNSLPPKFDRVKAGLCAILSFYADLEDVIGDRKSQRINWPLLALGRDVNPIVIINSTNLEEACNAFQ